MISLFKIFRTSSIQKKLTFYFLTAVMSISVVYSISYFMYIRVLEDKMMSSSLTTVAYIGNYVKKELTQIEHASDYIAGNNELKELLIMDNDNSFSYYSKMTKVRDMIANYFSTNIKFSYLSSLTIVGENGMVLQYGRYNGDIDERKLKALWWYDKVEELDGRVYWIGMCKNYGDVSQDVSGKKSGSMISVARLVKDSYLQRNLGTLYLGFNNQLLYDLFTQIDLPMNESVYITDNHDNIAYAKNMDQSGDTFPYTDYLAHATKKSYSIVKDKDGKKLLAHFNIERFGWDIVNVTPFNELVKEYRKINRLFMFVILMVIFTACILWLPISRNIVKPIKSLAATMKTVRDGNLFVKLDYEGNDEIKTLIESFNYMIKRINSLFNDVQYERMKEQEAEYVALQAQITPHFLCNTLNSIRCMAIIQKAFNIKETVEALGRLLIKSTDKTNRFITIEEELEIIKDYIYIQKIKYINKFNVQFNIEQNILKYKCFKFMLQPLVENAIFHGIEPKKGTGTIDISAYLIENSIRFCINDNGVGIASDQIERILMGEKPNDRGFSGLGIANVNERIKIIYGVQYGIDIESVVGSYTSVSVLIPVFE